MADIFGWRVMGKVNNVLFYSATALLTWSHIDKNPFSDFDVSIAKSEVTLQIYQYLLENPGKYLNQISNDTKIHYKTVKYHLDKLVDANMVYVEDQKKGRVKTLYYSRDLDLPL